MPQAKAKTITDAAAKAANKASMEDPAVVASVQAKMRELGYVDGGPATGEMGDKTKDQILAFRRRENLPLKAGIDEQLIAKLEVAEPKVLPVEQVTATALEIAPNVVAVSQTRWAKFWSKMAAIPSLLFSFLFAVLNQFEDAVKHLTPLKEFLSDVPGWVWIGGVGLAATLLAINLGRAEQSMTTAYRAGTLKNDNKEKKAAEADEAAEKEHE